MFHAAYTAIRHQVASPVTDAWISSVVPGCTTPVIQGILKAFGVSARTVAPGVRTGLKIRTDQPTELGSDLVCASVAGYAISSSGVVVVEFGKLIACCAVNSQAEFLGAAIAPGLAIARSSIKHSAALVGDVRLDRPQRAIGKTTEQAIQSGLFFGFSGLVQQLVTMMAGELGGSPMIIGCGDVEGRDLMALSGYRNFEPLLVLDGLALIAGLNGVLET